MPSTSLSDTLRSTSFIVSLAVSVTDFCAAILVVKCRGAGIAMALDVRARRRVAISVRKDMVICGSLEISKLLGFIRI